MGKRGLSIAERINALSMPEPNSGCVLWLGALDNNGYGRIKIQTEHGPSTALAHRVAYETFVGPIPEGLTLDHLCRTRGCINTRDLEPVTRSENNLRGFSPMAGNARKTHCPQGHAYSSENIYRSRKGSRRYCLACIKARSSTARPAAGCAS